MELGYVHCTSSSVCFSQLICNKHFTLVAVFRVPGYDVYFKSASGQF
jgi:hypothetical protein